VVDVDFDDIINTLSETIKTYDFFVDWEKIENNVNKVEKRLNILNYLIGKENFKEEFISLLKEYPEVITTFPILIAVRTHSLTVLNNKTMDLETLEFRERKKLSNEDIEKYYKFFKETGLENLLEDRKIKNLVDYVFGVEVGMDTNARKNRIGKLMENIVKKYIEDDLCSKYDNIEYIFQATKDKILNKWNINLILDKTDRNFDFAIFNKNKGMLYLIEVNFYSGGGSKLKATAGEYQTLNEFITDRNDKNIKFIWITDGKGWETAKNPLKESFNKGVIILNLEMVKNGLLEKIITE
jgi:type II restriction enzyme